MSDRRSLVIIKGEVKNNVSDYDDSSLYTVDVFFGNGKKYTYKKDNVQILHFLADFNCQIVFCQ